MTKEKQGGISSFSLHILAMLLMLCDHLWATLLPAQEWLTCIGRMAFPIFAFMLVEGYFHTSNVKRYMLRLLAFALISEIPFDLVCGSSVFYPYHQNVLWTFLIALLTIRVIERAKAKSTVKSWLLAVLAVLLGFLLATVTMVDYYGAGVLMVLTFYFFRGRKWWCFLGQLLCMYLLNIKVLGGYYYAVTIAGHELEIMQQGIALLALIPIWLYKGRQGYSSKGFRYACYAFYPAHLLLLYIIWQLTM